ncbi:MAG: DUF937 domain-containing protein [Pseudomonadota bacterium]
MLPLYEMVTRAQNGEAMRMMAEQYGLSVEQATRAMEALMPAFSTGLKRNTVNPQDFGSFMQALASGHYADYFNNFSEAFTPQGISEGNAMLGQIFGSKEVSRALAQQAELATGIAQDIYKRMMPVAASLLMGGLFNQANDRQPAARASGSDVFTGAFIQMMRQMAESQKQAAEFTGQLGKMMEDTFAKSGRTSGASLNPFADFMEVMMKSGFPAVAKQEEPEAAEPGNVYSQFISDMFDAGTKVQAQYQKNVDAVFDSFVKVSKS